MKTSKETRFAGKLSIESFLKGISAAERVAGGYFGTHGAGYGVTCGGKQYALDEHELSTARSLYIRSDTTGASFVFGKWVNVASLSGGADTHRNFTFILNFDGNNTVVSAECEGEDVLDAFFQPCSAGSSFTWGGIN